MSTHPDQPRRRAYHSERRAEQAASNRAAVIRAARELFEANGYGGTTIAAIAARAGVSSQMIYSAFGSKVALVRAILEQMEETADAATWRERIAGETDPARMLRAFAEWTRAFFEASRPSLAGAAATEPELADLAAQGDAHRRAALEALVSRIVDADRLRDGLSAAHAVDRAWLLTGIGTYVGATVTCGWSAETYSAWLADTLAQQLLDPGSTELVSG